MTYVVQLRSRQSAEKAQLVAKHKREKENLASNRRALGVNQKLEKANMGARHRNDMEYARRAARKNKK